LPVVSIPTGYLECDGREFNKADYPDLYAAIGKYTAAIRLEPRSIYRVAEVVPLSMLDKAMARMMRDRPLTNRVLGWRFGEEKHHLTVE
jgi:hypothetical protein